MILSHDLSCIRANRMQVMDWLEYKEPKPQHLKQKLKRNQHFILLRQGCHTTDTTTTTNTLDNLVAF